MHASLHVWRMHAKPSVMPEGISAGGRSLQLSRDTAAGEGGSDSQRKDGQTPKRLSRLGRHPGTFLSSCRLLSRAQYQALAVEEHHPTFVLGLQGHCAYCSANLLPVLCVLLVTLYSQQGTLLILLRHVYSCRLAGASAAGLDGSAASAEGHSMSKGIGSPRFSVLRVHLQQAASHHQRGGDASNSSSSSSSIAKDPIWRPMQSSVPRSARPLGSGISAGMPC